VIRLETDAARFDPAAAGAPELAAFNSALVLGRGGFESAPHRSRATARVSTRA